jgi:hypothetical protein
MSDKGEGRGPIRSAQELRKTVLEHHLSELEREDKAREREKKERAAFAEDFFRTHVSEDELAMINRLVTRAVAENKMEALVYSFPSDLCTDGGRAINNSLPNWPETLQGKAKELYDR